MKWIANLLILAGLGVLAADMLSAGEDGFRLTALGEWWFWAHPDSLQALQPAIERHVSVWLYESVIQPMLEWPASIQLIILGIFLLGVRALFRRRR